MRALAIAILLAPAVASAQRIEFVGRVTADTSYSVPSERSIGEPHFVALSGLIPSQHVLTDYHVEVLDLRSAQTSKIRTPRKELAAKFGEPRGHADAIPPRGTLVHWTPGHAGVALYHSEFSTHWYAELDAKTGKLGRSIELADGKGRELVTFIGTDPTRDAAWFAITDEAKRRIKLRRLDLKALAISDEMTVELRARKSTTGYEDRRFFHHAPDFSRFVIVEYFEGGMNMARGDVHVIDAKTRKAFAVEAPSTAYGVAVSPDGHHIYLGSCDTGVIARLEVATQRFDKRIKAAKLIHKLVITPNTQRMIVIGTDEHMTVLDIPSLGHPSKKRHAPELDDALKHAFGSDVWSLDRRFVVTHDYNGVFTVGKLVDD